MMMLFSGIGLKILVGLGIAIGIVWAYFGTLRRGAKDQRFADTKKTVENARVRSDVDTETHAKSDADISNDLRSHWTDKRM